MISPELQPALMVALETVARETGTPFGQVLATTMSLSTALMVATDANLAHHLYAESVKIGVNAREQTALLPGQLTA